MNQCEISFKLTANCIPVRGAERSAICDLHRKNIDIIPNDLFLIINNYEGNTIKEIKSIYNNEFNDIIDEYFDFLLKKEYIFFTETPDLFPKMSLEWHSPYLDTNAIIDINGYSNFDLFKILENLDNLNCKYVEIRFFKLIDMSILQKIIIFLNEIESSIVSVDFCLPFTNNLNNDLISTFILEFPRVSSLRIYSSP